MEALDQARVDVLQYGVEAVQNKLEHLKDRRKVWFPVLRAKLLLRKLRKMEFLCKPLPVKQ